MPSPPPAGLPVAARGNAKNVCVIDDDREVCDLLRLMLRSRGIGCECAHDGDIGLALVRACRPDLVVLDMRLPGLGGYDVLVRLQRDPATTRTPVLVLTGVTEKETRPDAEWARTLDVADFVTKPVDSMVLLARVRRLLGRAEEKDEGERMTDE